MAAGAARRFSHGRESLAHGGQALATPNQGILAFRGPLGSHRRMHPSQPSSSVHAVWMLGAAPLGERLRPAWPSALTAPWHTA